VSAGHSANFHDQRYGPDQQPIVGQFGDHAHADLPTRKYGAHCLKWCTATLYDVRRTACHQRQCCGDCAVRPATHRAVDHFNIPRRQFLSQRFAIIGVDSAHDDDHAARTECRERAGRAAQHLLRLRLVDNDGHEDVGFRPDARGVFRLDQAFFGKRLYRLASPVGATHNRKTMLQEVTSHGFAHFAQADKADSRLCHRVSP